LELDLKFHYPVDPEEYVLFRDFILKHSGIVIPPEKTYLIETRLSRLMAEAGYEDFGKFYTYVVSGRDPLLPQKIINAITTNETLWFRDATPWRVLEEFVLPPLVKAMMSGEKSRIRIWLSAVSTGQEAYSTAMCVDNYLKTNNIRDISLSDFDFFATDISSRVLDYAKRARYDGISITRGLSEYYRDRYFTKNGMAWELDPRIKQAIRFRQFNLHQDYSEFGIFDVIFCRYVLIYFSEEKKREIINKLYNALDSRGVLFTGNYALYELFADKYDANHFKNLTYYTKKNPKF